MKIPVRVLLSLLCAGLILAMPFVISSPDLLEETKSALMNEEGEGAEDEGGEEIDFGRLFLSTAYAEDDLEVETLQEGELTAHPEWKLPIDFSVPPMPNPACYTENGYEDESIRVTAETRETDGLTIHVVSVKISDPSQLKTAIAGSKVTSSKTAHVADMAATNHAVVAMNGDYYTQVPNKKTFEYRMTQKIRSKTNKLRDTLIIDENGDFHLFVRSVGINEYSGKVINGFTFGPALVKDGNLLVTDTEYAYAPNYKNPRSAIGQTGSLSYLMVVVEGRGESGGVTHQEMAQIMYDLGCVQAYNLDGGNTAEIVMMEGYETGKPSVRSGFHFKGDQTAGVRPQSDIIYFATLVPEEQWQ